MASQGHDSAGIDPRQAPAVRGMHALGRERVLRPERCFGGASCKFALPAELDEANDTAKYDSGVLELKRATKPAVAGRNLAVL